LHIANGGVKCQQDYDSGCSERSKDDAVGHCSEGRMEGKRKKGRKRASERKNKKPFNVGGRSL
jgi:hypothetical protein